MRPLFRAILALGLLGVVAEGAGGVAYKWVDESGGVHYGDCPPADCASEEVHLRAGPSQEDAEKARQRLQRHQDVLRGIEVGGVPDSVAEPGEAAPSSSDEARCFSDTSRIVTGPSADRFASISPTPLTDKDRRTLDDLFRRLDGDWHGTITESTCQGDKEEPRTNVRQSRVDSRIRWDDKRHRLINHADGIGEDRSVSTLFQGIEVGDMLYFNNLGESHSIDLADNAVELLALDQNSLVFLLKVSFTSREAATRRRTDVRRFYLNGKTLEIAELYYHDGMLTGRNDWRLQRR